MFLNEKTFVDIRRKRPNAAPKPEKVSIPWETPKVDLTYECITIDDMDSLKKAIQEIKDKGVFSFDYETTPKRETRKRYSSAIARLETLLAEDPANRELKYDLRDVQENFKKTALSPQDSEVFSIQFTGDPKKCYIIWELHQKPELFDYIKKEVMLDPDILKIAFNLKFEAKFTQPCRIAGKVADPLLMGVRVSQAIFPDNVTRGGTGIYQGFGLKKQALDILNYKMTEYSSLVDIENFEFFDDAYYKNPEASSSYAGDDAIMTLHLYHFWNNYAKQIPTIQSEVCKDYSEWLHFVEMPFFKVIGELEYWGMRFDTEKAEVARGEAKKRSEESAKKLIAIANDYGVVVEPGKTGKTASVKKFLFDILKAPCEVFSDKTGDASLDETSIILMLHNLKNQEVFDEEENQIRLDTIEVLNCIKTIQKMGTLLSSHINGRLKFVGSDGRIHANYTPFTDTARLNSSQPNGQNVPRGDKDPLGVRKMYVPEQGKVFVMIDFSGFELRLLAWAAKEEKMQAAFHHGDDLHYMAAEMFYNKPRSEISKAERSIAKAGIFGFNYGGSGHSLQNTLIKNDVFLEIEECDKMMSSISDTFPGIKKFQLEMKRFAKDYDFVETIYGYRRLLPDIHSPRPFKVASATRQAGNTRIQGSAADIMKRAQINIYETFINDTRIRQIAQIHDEIIFELDDDEDYIKSTIAKLIEIMEKPPIENFPLKVEVEASFAKESWGDKNVYKG